MAMVLLRQGALLALLSACVVAFDDEVKQLPGFDKPLPSPIYAGYTSVSADPKDTQNQLFYFFTQAEDYSSSTPTLIWLNGGPGASSLMGLFVEHLGPFDIDSTGALKVNTHRLTKKYNLLGIDNPVGAGFSYTENEAYVKDETEMRRQFVQGLRNFYAMHPELLKHDLWVTGESYAGKYIPNIVHELDLAIAGDKASGGQLSSLKLQGMIVGNPMVYSYMAYKTIGEYAYSAGVIDESTLATVEANQQECLKHIESGDRLAGDFCENVTVRYLYWETAKIPMYYDLGLQDLDLDSISSAMEKYLGRDDVKAALHVTGHTWQNQDEEGPVAEALRADFTIPSLPVVVDMVEKGYRVAIYNGVRDGSACNHIGNTRAFLEADKTWKFKGQFAASKNVPMMFQPATGKPYVMAYNRVVENFSFTKMLHTGHLVPTVVPDQFESYIEWVIGSNATSPIAFTV
mmetsp:Transcript_30224/g.55153  ORF Transcript_30224/g.55153 Transcript_30224/m.55153 type:complete len:459 (+) Transcript_30224:40-1416(+)